MCRWQVSLRSHTRLAQPLDTLRRKAPPLRVIRQTSDPEGFIRLISRAAQFSDHDYVRIWAQNLDEALCLHTGPEDVPSGSQEISSRSDRSAFSVNRTAYLRMLQKDVDLFQFTFFDFEMRFTDPEDEEEPKPDRVIKPDTHLEDVVFPNWRDVAVVCWEKDVDLDAVIKAAEEGRIRGGYDGAGVFRVAPDTDYELWKPRRHRKTLLRRRLKLIGALSAADTVQTNERLFQLVSAAEHANHGPSYNASPKELEAQMRKTLPHFPSTPALWRDSVEHLLLWLDAS